ncbi:MAG: dihydrodipicolinate reductase, partial [Thermoanaerobaculia bacterium]|nr:dihydrodipicolinate reductase [Thermoanaerobaculia bacterium]
AKVGAGLTREEFESGVAARKLGHVGLSESAALIAVGLGFPIDQISETIEPVLAEQETDGVAPGRVLGLHQIAVVRVEGETKVELDLTMAVGVEEPSDRIEIQGDPPVHLVVTGGFHGDRATVGCVVNAIHFVTAAPPGLHTVVTLPLFGLLPQ